jgi:hypothetical protein
MREAGRSSRGTILLLVDALTAPLSGFVGGIVGVMVDSGMLGVESAEVGAGVVDCTGILVGGPDGATVPVVSIGPTVPKTLVGDDVPVVGVTVSIGVVGGALIGTTIVVLGASDGALVVGDGVLLSSVKSNT